MRAHIWIEFKGTVKKAVFVAAMAAMLAFVARLPSDAWEPLRRVRIPLPFVMIAAWSGGWFSLLFVRAEDLRVLAPLNYQTFYRMGASLAIGFGAIVAGLLYSTYLPG